MTKGRGAIAGYFAAILIGGGICWFILTANSFQTIEDTAEKYRVLSNAFTSPGVILLAVGALVWVSTTGTLDMFSYAGRGLLRRFIPGARINSPAERETFYDYTQKKNEKRAKGYGFLFVTGGLFTAVGIVFLILFHTVA